MSPSIVPLSTPVGITAAEAHTAVRQAQSQVPSQAWTDALAQATARPASHPALPMRSSPGGAPANADKSVGPAQASAAADHVPSSTATEQPDTSSDTRLGQIIGGDTPTNAPAEPAQPSQQQVMTDATGTETIADPMQGTTGTVTMQARAMPKHPLVRQPAAETRTVVPNPVETVQNGIGTETASTAAAPSPVLATHAALSGQSAALPRDERQRHPQPGATHALAAWTNPSAGPSPDLAGHAAAVATAAPLPSDRPPAAPSQPGRDGTVAPAETSPGRTTAALPDPAVASPPRPIGILASTATDAAAHRGTAQPSMDSPAPAPTGPAQAAGSDGRMAKASAIAPLPPVPGASPVLSVSPPAQTTGSPPIHGQAEQEPPRVTPPGAQRPLPPLQARATGPAPAAIPPAGQPIADLPIPAQTARTQISPSPPGRDNGPAQADPQTASQKETMPAGSSPPDPPADATRMDVAAPVALLPQSPPIPHPAAGETAGLDVTALGNRPQATQATTMTPIAARTPMGTGPALNLAVPQLAVKAEDNAPAIGHGLFASGSAPAAVIATSPAPFAVVAAGSGGIPQPLGPSSVAGMSQPPFPGQAPIVPATATALAASVVAMSQNGQSTSVLRLDPPGLGALSIHIALTANATVNVVFVPSVVQTAQLIHSALPDLHHAMAAAGLSLGEAQVGGGTGGNPNAPGHNRTGDESRAAQTTILSRIASEADRAIAKDALRGARAVA